MSSWDDAPVGLLTLRPDGTVVEANQAFLDWLDRPRTDVEGRRLPDLVTVGGRIFWETHLAPLLLVDGRVDEVALELRVPGGRMPVLVTAVVQGDRVRVAVSSARERWRYERELLAARTAAERSATQVRALQQVTAALSRAVGVAAVGRALLAAALGPLGAEAGTLWLADPDDGLVLWGNRGEGAGALPPLLDRPVEQDGRLVVPLRGQAVLQGVLSLLPVAGEAAEHLDEEVLTAVGQQAGLALDRARAYEVSAGVAHALQQSLLATAAPVDPRYAVATTYRPGVEMLEVGGDWYDVFLADQGVLSVVVGDVVGRGLAAASAMGQLRSAVRAVAAPGVGPARLLERLDAFVEQVEAAGMATLAYAELDLGTGRVRYACAGHPPPVLLPADGAPALLWGGRSTPLGAFVQPQAREQAEVQLRPGDRLLLYTDGLVERRDRALDDGLRVLTDAAARVGALPLDEGVQALTRELLVDEQVRDDVCVLLLRWCGGHFAHDLTADLHGLAATRAGLRTWLAAVGVGRDTADDLVLATSEVVANAAEHGGGLRPTERVHVSAQVEGDAVVVSVRDAGQWRSPVTSDERGRGLRIAAALVDHVEVDRAATGTTVVLRRRVRP